MAFTWAETIVQGVTIVKASHANELHANIDTVRKSIVDPGTGKAMLGYAWTRNPITKESDLILGKDFIEMQTALDEGYNKNLCITHNGAENKTHNASDNGAHDHNHDNVVQSPFNGTHKISDYVSDKSPTNTAVLTGDDAVVDSVDNLGYEGAYQFANYTPNLVTNDLADDSPDNDAVQTAHKSSNHSGNWTGEVES